VHFLYNTLTTPAESLYCLICILLVSAHIQNSREQAESSIQVSREEKLTSTHTRMLLAQCQQMLGNICRHIYTFSHLLIFWIFCKRAGWKINKRCRYLRSCVFAYVKAVKFLEMTMSDSFKSCYPQLTRTT